MALAPERQLALIRLLATRLTSSLVLELDVDGERNAHAFELAADGAIGA